MKIRNELVRWLQVLVISLVCASASAAPDVVTVTRTNWVSRWITNTVEIRMPTNIFVNQYHTNWATQFTTNFIEVYTTNWSAKTLTNRIAVNLIRTNIATAYQTNWQTLSLTNWETVLVMKTNWITRPVTNVVELNLPANLATRKPAPAPAEAKMDAAPVSARTAAAGALALDARKSSGVTTNGLIGVVLGVRVASDPAAPLQVIQWRVERTDGSFLGFGQDRDFKKELAPGKYDVEVRAKREDNNVLIARAALEVAAERLDLQPKLKAGSAVK